MGLYLDHDQSYEASGEMRVARILVNMDIRKGLPLDMKIKLDTLSLTLSHWIMKGFRLSVIVVMYMAT